VYVGVPITGILNGLRPLGGTAKDKGKKHFSFLGLITKIFSLDVEKLKENHHRKNSPAKMKASSTHRLDGVFKPGLRLSGRQGADAISINSNKIAKQAGAPRPKLRWMETRALALRN